MYKFYQFLTIALFSIQIGAQPYSLDWVSTFQTQSVPYQNAIDAAGNIYTMGTFSGDMDFDPSSTSQRLHPGKTGNFTFISKYDPLSNLDWALSLSGGKQDTFGGVKEITGFAIDQSGYCYISGYLGDSLLVSSTVFPGQIFPLNNPYQSFLMKVSPNGRVLWVKQFGGGSKKNHARINDISIDINQDLLLTGAAYWYSNFDFNGGSFPDTGTGSIFVMRVDSGANRLWFNLYSGREGGAEGKTIDSDQFGNIVISGTFTDTLFLPPTHVLYSEFTRHPTGLQIFEDHFIAKINPVGDVVFAHSLNSKDISTPNSNDGHIAIDPSGNVNYVCGVFDTLRIDHAAPGFIKTNNQRWSTLLIQFDSQGNINWTNYYDEPNGRFTFYDLMAHKNGDIYMTGALVDTVGLNLSQPLAKDTSTGGGRAYLLKLNSSGQYQWHFTLPGNGFAFGHCISIDSSESIYIGGAYNQTIDFDPSTSVFEKTFSSSSALVNFNLKVINSPISTSQQSLIGCDSLVYNGKMYYHNGFIQDTLTSKSLNDSLVRSEIFIIDIDTTILLNTNGSLYTPEWTADSFQWVDCNNNFNPIPGATGQDFKPIINGSYAVLVTRDSCSEYSACYNYQVVSTDEFDQTAVSVFPNPVKDALTVDFGAAFEGAAEVMVYDAAGQLVKRESNISEASQVIDFSGLPAGIYIVKAQSGSSLISKKVIKE